MSTGWIKLHRKLLDNPVMSNPNVCCLFIHLLLRASYREYDVISGSSVVHLMPGDLLYGHHWAAKQTGMSVKNVRTALGILKMLSMIRSKQAGKGQVLTVCNWDTYQSDRQEEGSERASNGQATGNVQEVKKGKKVKNVKEYSMSFLEFWERYPRKDAKAEAFSAWTKNGCESSIAEIVSALKWQIKSEQWVKDEGQFIPQARTYLNKRRWEDEPTKALHGTSEGKLPYDDRRPDSTQQ